MSRKLALPVLATVLLLCGGSSTTPDPAALPANDSENAVGTSRTDYSIDERTVSGWGYLVVSNRHILAKGSTSGTILASDSTQAAPFVFGFLYSDGLGRGSVAEDVLVFGQKESFHFNAENSARAELLAKLVYFTMSPAQKLRVYDLIPEEPAFEELVQLYARAKRIPTDEEVNGRKTDLQAAIFVAILEKMSLDPS